MGVRLASARRGRPCQRCGSHPAHRGHDPAPLRTDRGRTRTVPGEAPARGGGAHRPQPDDGHRPVAFPAYPCPRRHRHRGIALPRRRAGPALRGSDERRAAQGRRQRRGDRRRPGRGAAGGAGVALDTVGCGLWRGAGEGHRISASGRGDAGHQRQDGCCGVGRAIGRDGVALGHGTTAGRRADRGAAGLCRRRLVGAGRRRRAAGKAA